MLAANWFKQPVKADSIKVGSVYKLAHEGNIVEIAKVVDVGPDALGIPHAAAFDLSAGCTGFVYALNIASIRGARSER